MKQTLTPLRAAKLVLSAATLLLAALLIAQCASIYSVGTSTENLTEAGVRLADIYSPEIVAERLLQIAWAFVLWFTALAATVAIKHIWKETKPTPSPASPKARHESAKNDNGLYKIRDVSSVLRIALYAGAIALIIAGIANGGMRDVLVKAINICTECIGLG